MKTVPEMLREAAGIYEERGLIYGDGYKRIGDVIATLLPKFNWGIGIPNDEKLVNDLNRLGLLVQIITKLTRYCENFNNGGHGDSLDDLAVYAMMLKELDMVEVKDTVEYQDLSGKFYEFSRAKEKEK